MILKAKHSKVYLCCEDEVSGSGSTRPDTNSAPESTRSCVYQYHYRNAKYRSRILKLGPNQ